VDLKAGLVEHGPWNCRGVFCTSHDSLRLHRSPVVLVETAHKGWKFTGWWGACNGNERTCVIDLGHKHPNAAGRRNIRVGARYIPTAPGFTRRHPIPLGATARIGSGLGLRINSAPQSVELSPAPPADSEYVAANVTLSYGDGVSPFATGGSLSWSVIGSRHKTYTIGPDQCPSAPQPQLDLDSPIYRGRSVTGYVCWTIGTDDAGSLELYYGTGGPHPGGTVRFALH
jgi:hypothetical protein